MTWRALLACCWTLIILGLCWTPRMYLGGEERLHPPFFVPNIDKLVHLGIFAVFSYLWMRVDSPRFRAGRILIVGLALALITELGQTTPIVRRDATWGDGLADALGVVVGLAVQSLSARFREGREAPLEA
jgi:hypothetical protein